jgi:NADPH:quinone reductase-like Zn-dependent oxidoreductase
MFLALPSFRPIPLMNENRGVFGLNLGRLWSEADLLRDALGEILELVGKRVLTPVVDGSHPFDRAGEAHARLQSRQSFGKVLLRP